MQRLKRERAALEIAQVDTVCGRLVVQDTNGRKTWSKEYEMSITVGTSYSEMLMTKPEGQKCRRFSRPARSRDVETSTAAYKIQFPRHSWLSSIISATEFSPVSKGECLGKSVDCDDISNYVATNRDVLTGSAASALHQRLASQSTMGFWSKEPYVLYLDLLPSSFLRIPSSTNDRRTRELHRTLQMLRCRQSWIFMHCIALCGANKRCRETSLGCGGGPQTDRSWR